MAYGVLGLSVEELAGLTPFVFEIKCEGYRKQRRELESWFRKSTAINITPHTTGNINSVMKQLWPIYDEDYKPQVMFTKAHMKKIATRYKEMKKQRLAKLENNGNL